MLIRQELLKRLTYRRKVVGDDDRCAANQLIIGIKDAQWPVGYSMEPNGIERLTFTNTNARVFRCDAKSEKFF